MSYEENQENVNPNSLSTLSSLTGLEELIKGAHQSNMSSQSDLLHKLKALQLIEQMISTQEQLLSHSQGDGRDLQQSTDSSLSRENKDLLPMDSVYVQGQGKPSSSSPPALPISLPVGDACESVPSLDDTGLKGHVGSSGEDITDRSAPTPPIVKPGDGTSNEGIVALAQSKNVEEGEHARSSERNTTVKPRHRQNVFESNRLSLKEKREEQLRLLNEKIAQRHSKVPHRRDQSSRSAQTSSSSSSAVKKSSSAVKKTISGSRKLDFSKPKPNCGRTGLHGRDKAELKKAKVTTKGSKKGSLSSKSAPALCNSGAMPSSKVSTSSNTARSNESPPHVPPTHIPESHSSSHIPLSHSPPSHVHHVVNDSPSSQSKVTSTQTQLHSLQTHVLNGNPLSCDPSNHVIATDVHTSLVLEATSLSQLLKSEEDTTAADDLDLLDSTSYLIPVDDDGDKTLVADLSTMTDEDFLGPPDLSTGKENTDKVDVQHEVSLTSTLTQAYGFSTNSDFLSTLASPHKEEEPSRSNRFKSKNHFDLQEMIKSPKKSSEEETSSAVQTSPSQSASVPISAVTAHRAATIIQTAWYIVSVLLITSDLLFCFFF